MSFQKKPKPRRVAILKRADGTEQAITCDVLRSSHCIAFRFDHPVPMIEGDTIAVGYIGPLKDHTNGTP